MNVRKFFAELKRRNVYKVAIAYAIVAWLLIQVATQVFPFFKIPNWGVRLIVLFIVIGFPIALIIAWAFELTPEGGCECICSLPPGWSVLSSTRTRLFSNLRRTLSELT